MMDDRERLEEAHGIWELAVVRLATMAEVGTVGDGYVDSNLFKRAVAEERAAFNVWRRVSEEAVTPFVIVEPTKKDGDG